MESIQLLYAFSIPNLINIAIKENKIVADITDFFIVTNVSRDHRCVGKI